MYVRIILYVSIYPPLPRVKVKTAIRKTPENHFFTIPALIEERPVTITINKKPTHTSAKHSPTTSYSAPERIDS